MKPQRRATNFWFLPGRSRVLFQPLGVVGIVVPWNYPIYLAISPAVDALAAGNRALIKMSESAPAVGELLARLVAERFDPAVLSVVNGDAAVASAFTALPFDHLLFTGSTEVGRRVMRAAAENLTPVTLELGGKSPAIVGRGIAVEEAADRILYGKCLNAGQTCIAPDYAWCPRSASSVRRRRAQDRGRDVSAHARQPRLHGIVKARHRERLAGYPRRRDSAARGSKRSTRRGGLRGLDKMPPTLVFGAPAETAVMREEIFGPILPVVATARSTRRSPM